MLVDANIFLSVRNRRERGNPTCRKLVDRLDGGFQAIVSTVTNAELRSELSPEDVRTFWGAMLTYVLTSPGSRNGPVDSYIAEVAGELRSSTRLSHPDTLVVATGGLRGARLIETQDQELTRT